jgi:hypothetical protein
MTTEKLQDKIWDDNSIGVNDVKQKLSDLKKELEEIWYVRDCDDGEINKAFAKHIGDKLGGGE